ncbi:MAG: hypothetical protein ACFB50_10740 [Rubrobacteraceae bacterium]
MRGYEAKCAHLKGLQALPGSKLRCPVCDEVLQPGDVERWVREAEKARDEAYLLLEGDGFGEIAREERQREVYRRRRILYELRDISRAAARPEMIFVAFDERAGCYECRIFYKEPRPAWCIERIAVEASHDELQELKEHSDPVARLVAGKVLEFHRKRLAAHEKNEDGPVRRVFYANELQY